MIIQIVILTAILALLGRWFSSKKSEQTLARQEIQSCKIHTWGYSQTEDKLICRDCGRNPAG